MTKENQNICFIDAQNLHLGTKTDKWKIDFKRFRIYLKEKFKVSECFIFVGCLDFEQNELYKNLQKSGFIIQFREHNPNMIGKKKGNVDTDIIFEIMHRILENDDFEKIILVTGDGDYFKTVKYLISKNKFEKILFPNNKYSSLYDKISFKYGLNLGLEHNRKKFEYLKK